MGRKKLNNAVLFMRVPKERLEELRELIKNTLKK
jgi:hypothetical protein